MATTYEPIATTTLGSAAASITFSSIASSWTDLRVVLVAKGTVATGTRMRLNSDTSTNYSWTYLSGYGTGTSSSRASNVSYAAIDNFLTSLSTTNPHLYTIDFFSYAGSTNKTYLITNSSDDNGSGSTDQVVGLWRSTSAITDIQLYTSSSTFAAGTTATLYGIKNA